MRSTGCLRDAPDDVRGEPLAGLRAVAGDPPPSVDLRGFVTRIPNQRGESCVGHALAQALRTRSSIMRRPIDPSALGIYGVARGLEFPGQRVLPDRGSYVSKALLGLHDFGVVARHRWNDDAPLTRAVPVDVLEAGALAYVTGEYRVTTAREVRQALAAGYPVLWARDIDAEYMRWTRGTYPGVLGEVVGGHAGCLVGYDGIGPIDAGSWGETHGAGGFVRQDWDFIESPHVHGMWVITLAPLEVA